MARNGTFDRPAGCACSKINVCWSQSSTCLSRFLASLNMSLFGLFSGQQRPRGCVVLHFGGCHSDIARAVANKAIKNRPTWS